MQDFTRQLQQLSQTQQQLDQKIQQQAGESRQHVQQQIRQLQLHIPQQTQHQPTQQTGQLQQVQAHLRELAAAVTDVQRSQQRLGDELLAQPIVTDSTTASTFEVAGDKFSASEIDAPDASVSARTTALAMHEATLSSAASSSPTTTATSTQLLREGLVRLSRKMAHSLAQVDRMPLYWLTYLSITDLLTHIRTLIAHICSPHVIHMHDRQGPDTTSYCYAMTS